eukprot:PhF_6_TR37498/c0_g1_i3/m.55360
MLWLLVLLFVQLSFAQHRSGLLCPPFGCSGITTGNNQFFSIIYSAIIKEVGIENTFLISIDSTNSTRSLRDSIQNHSLRHIVGTFEWTDLMGEFATKYTDLFFTIIDTFYLPNQSPNLQVLVFREDQSGFIAGLFAGLQTRKNHVAVLAGPGYPPLFKFRNGFQNGVRTVCPTCVVDGFFGNNFDNTEEGVRLGGVLYSRGADVIFGAAGGTGSASILSLSNRTFVIGVDNDEYYTTFINATQIQKKNLLGSAIKRVDVAVSYSIREAIEHRFVSGWKSLDITVDGVGLSDCHDSCSAVDGNTRLTLQSYIDNLKRGAIGTNVDPASGYVQLTTNASTMIDLSNHFGTPLVLQSSKIALLGDNRLVLLSKNWSQIAFFNIKGNSLDYGEYAALGASVTPESRVDFTFVSAGDAGYLFGGKTQQIFPTVLGDLWSLTFPCVVTGLCGASPTWEQINVTSPGYRFGHTCVMNATTAMVCFGGSDEGAQITNDVFVFTLSNHTWTTHAVGAGTVGSVPPPRQYHAATMWNPATFSKFYSAEPSMIVYGGRSIRKLNDMWMLSLVTLKWTAIVVTGTSPTARLSPCLVSFDSRLYLSMGTGEDGLLQDSWIFSSAHDQWIQTQAPKFTSTSGPVSCIAIAPPTSTDIRERGMPKYVTTFHSVFTLADGLTSAQSFTLRTLPAVTCNETAGVFLPPDGLQCFGCGKGYVATKTECVACSQLSSEAQSAHRDQCPTFVDSLDVGLIVGVMIGGLTVLLLPLIWYGTRNYRKMRKLLDNNKVATELAESIANLKFDEVQYLDNIENPTRIQKAFISIVSNIKVYKSYMPQTLFAAPDDAVERPTEPITEESPINKDSDTTCSFEDCDHTFSNKLPKVKFSAAVARLVENGFRAVRASFTTICIPPTDVEVVDPKQHHDALQSFIQNALLTLEEYDGVLYYMGGDKIIASWNAFKPGALHEQTAAKAGLSIRESYHSSGMHSLGPCTIVLTSSKVFVGYIGTEKVKTPVIHGEAITEIPLLVMLSDVVGADVLATQAVAKKLPVGPFCTVLADNVRCGPQIRTKVYHVLPGPTEIETVMAEFHNDDERYHNAMSAFLQSNYEKSLELFVEFVEKAQKFPASSWESCYFPQVVRLARLCKYLHKEGGGRGTYIRRFVGWEQYERKSSLHVSPDELPEIIDNISDCAMPINPGSFAFSPKTKLSPEEIRAKLNQSRNGGGSGASDASSRRSSGVSIPATPTSPLASKANAFIDQLGNKYHRSTKVLGTGATATVWLGMQEDGGLVALKELTIPPEEAAVPETRSRRPQKKKKDELEELVKEVSLMVSLRHENIVAFLGCAVVEAKFVIITEYVSGGSLHGVLTSFGSLPFSSLQRYLRDILHGLQYLHEQNIVHRDIKPHNVLLMIDGQCKLTDFGAAAEINSLVSSTTITGTPTYMSKEACKGTVSKTSDIWALGIMTCELLTGRLPFPEELMTNFIPARFIYMMSTSDKPLYQIPDASEIGRNAHDFISGCLNMDPEQRPTCEQLLTHAFLL